MAVLDDESRPTDPAGRPAISEERRNDLNRALYYILAKRRCRGHALSCFLDELPVEFIPRQVRDEPKAAALDGELIVSPSFRYEPHGAAPADLGDKVPLMDGLLRGVPLAWIADPGTGVWAPYSVRGEWVDVLQSLRPGQPVPPALPARIRRTLALADVLVAPASDADRRQQWDTICRDAGAQFRARGYTIVRNLIRPVHIGALRRYYRALVSGGQLARGDDQVAERHRLHSEPVATFFHPQLADLMSRLAAEPVKPSYLYFASYPSGSALPRHVDRAQCEFSMSLLVDYSPDPDGACGWPLFLEHATLPNGVVAADLGIGDAVFYRGRELAHYRDRLPDGHESSSVFFHYVRADFVGRTF